MNTSRSFRLADFFYPPRSKQALLPVGVLVIFFYSSVDLIDLVKVLRRLVGGVRVIFGMKGYSWRPSVILIRGRGRFLLNTMDSGAKFVDQG